MNDDMDHLPHYLKFRALIYKQLERWEHDKVIEKTQKKGKAWSNRYRELEYRIRGMREFLYAFSMEYIDPYLGLDPKGIDNIVLDSLDVKIIQNFTVDDPSWVSELSDTANVARSTIYTRLDRLKQVGLIYDFVY